MIKDQSFECLENWAMAVYKKNIDDILVCYADNATLWPTLSDVLRTSKDDIIQYFNMFLPKINGPVHWDTSHSQILNETQIIWSGIYTFEMVNQSIKARYTIIVNCDQGQCNIIHHHSSLMPK